MSVYVFLCVSFVFISINVCETVCFMLPTVSVVYLFLCSKSGRKTIRDIEVCFFPPIMIK